MLHTNEPFQANNWDDVQRLIALCQAEGAIGQSHLLRALCAGRIAFLPMPPNTSSTKFKDWARQTSHRPAVALIGDDDGAERGPAGWTCAERTLRWSRAVLIHAAGAEIAHYETAIVAAELIHRVLIIECGTATLDAWVSLVRAAPHHPATMVIRPRGGVHPLPVDWSKMQ